ncbi:hypothetical protein BY996DRAFT_2385034 [Phakopsora pachyrhizi]|uniref:Secreted protein n=1 Tax=Phakopsora pachyrhizi TaxID=170000 RepID=A0AAV0AV35_PHAPC|nr:hypothetical protein BY996DRAFT_2385034 [Phakopsora pachyrhizi]CAH7673001.1 hypothetical protein PPACK8108_LOCUS7862 [Phakopsora pachyrhizi]
MILTISIIVIFIVNFKIHSTLGHLALVKLDSYSNGFTGQGFGIDNQTRRDGTARSPFQLDTAVIREEDISNGIASVCGRTLQGGVIPMPESFIKAENLGLPDVGPDGKLYITGHQINSDGGGPYSCAVDYTATGLNFDPVQMEVNIPGRNGRSDAKAADLPILATLPSGAKCTGGSDGQSCIVRCLNGAKAGPFGGCLAFTQKTSASRNSNSSNKNAGNNNKNNVDNNDSKVGESNKPTGDRFDFNL